MIFEVYWFIFGQKAVHCLCHEWQEAVVLASNCVGSQRVWVCSCKWGKRGAALPTGEEVTLQLRGSFKSVSRSFPRQRSTLFEALARDSLHNCPNDVLPFRLDFPQHLGKLSGYPVRAYPRPLGASQLNSLPFYEPFSVEPIETFRTARQDACSVSCNIAKS